MTKNVKVTVEIPGQEPVVYEGYDLTASEGMQYEPKLTDEDKGPFKITQHEVEIKLTKNAEDQWWMGRKSTGSQTLDNLLLETQGHTDESRDRRFSIGVLHRIAEELSVREVEISRIREDLQSRRDKYDAIMKNPLKMWLMTLWENRRSRSSR